MRKSLLTLITLFLFTYLQAQDLSSFQKVDEFKISGATTAVYFKDPLLALIKLYPDIDNKDNNEKHNLLLQYLYKNPVYIFQTKEKKKILKTYVLRGDERKVRTTNFYMLEIYNGIGEYEKTIDRVGVGGSFFDQMAIFQTKQGKAAVSGGATQIWGYIVRIERYDSVKSAISKLIVMDANDKIPGDIIRKAVPEIQPLYNYESCGLSTIKSRQMIITVYQYDSLGNIKNTYPRTETDSTLYPSFLSADITGATTFPFFSLSDTVRTVGDTDFVSSVQPNIQHYLKEVKVIRDSSGKNVKRIEAKLIIHSYSAKGEDSYDELYVADFGNIGSCSFPVTVKFCNISDTTYLKPRIIINISYSLK